MDNSDLLEIEAAAAASGSAVAPQRPAGLTTRVVRGSIWNLGGQGATLLATLVATPFVIRLLGAELYGLLALISVLIGYFAFADLGMGWASTRFASAAHANGDEQGEATVVWTALVLAALPSLLFSAVLVIGARPLIVDVLRLPPHLHETAVIALRIAAVGFVARALAGVLNTPELVRLRMDLLVLVNVGTLIPQILLVPIVLYFGAGLPGAVALIAGAGLISALLHFWVGLRLFPSLRRPRFTSELVKPLVQFGWPMVISGLAGMALSNADRLLLSRYGSVRDLAYYAVALNLALMLAQAPMAMVQSLMPAFSQLQANPDRTALRELYRRSLRGTLYWVAPAAVFICVIARPFFTSWAGPEFGRESTVLLYLLAAGLVCEVMAYVPYTLLMALGRSDLIARLQVGVLIPYLIVAAFAIRWYGAVGAAAVWSLRAIVSTVSFSIVVHRISGFRFSPLPVNVSGYLGAMAVLIVPVLIACWFSSSDVVRLGVAIIALAVHGGMILGYVLTAEERKWVLRLLPVGPWRHLRQDS